MLSDVWENLSRRKQVRRRQVQGMRKEAAGRDETNAGKECRQTSASEKARKKDPTAAGNFDCYKDW